MKTKIKVNMGNGLNSGVLSQRELDKIASLKTTINLSGRRTTPELQEIRKERKKKLLIHKLLSQKTTLIITIILITFGFNYLFGSTEAHDITRTQKNYDSMGVHGFYLAHFPTVKTVIGCYNDRTKTTREAMKCTKRGDHNITLPIRDQIKIWLKYFNESEITNRLALVNFESNFDPNAGNAHAKGYVQTLRSYRIPNDIDSQLKWLKRRQASQSVVINGKSKRCGYYWKNKNYIDGFNAGEYGVLSCLYRYHYHAYKGTWYAKRGITTTKFYKKYMFGVEY